LALAVGVAATAVGLAAADIAASTILAVVGLPIAAYAAILQLSRTAVTASLIALAANVSVVGYWAYMLFDALRRGA
jgi:hypothetical protein